MSTSLYLTFVLPGSSPSAVEKLIVMSGPRSMTDLATSAMPTSAAMSGTSQTSEGSQPDERTCSNTSRSGGSSGSGGGQPFEEGGCPCGLVMVSSRVWRAWGTGVRAVPNQARIELKGREHRQHDDAGERERAPAGRD